MKNIIKIIKRLFLAAFILLVISLSYILIVDYNSEYSKTERVFRDRFHDAKDQGRDRIYIKDLVDFKWDKVFFAPFDYFDTELEAAIGKKYSGPRSASFCDYGIAELIFVTGDKVRVINTGFCQINSDCDYVPGDNPRFMDCSRNPYITVTVYKEDPKYGNSIFYKIIQD